MKCILNAIYLFTLLSLISVNICIAGPSVILHPKSPTIKVWDNKFVIVQEFKTPKKIKTIQDIFLRSKRIGNTSSHLISPTHKIDFSDRWLLDIKSGEIRMLSKAVVNVYQITPEDLKILKKLIKTKK